MHLPVVEARVRYLQPARLDDLLEIHVRPHDVKRASFSFDYEVRRGDDLLARGYTRHAAVERESLRPLARARVAARAAPPARAGPLLSRAGLTGAALTQPQTSRPKVIARGPGPALRARRRRPRRRRAALLPAPWPRDRRLVLQLRAPICYECMTPAAVGFRCPECIAEQRRDSGRSRVITRWPDARPLAGRHAGVDARPGHQSPDRPQRGRLRHRGPRGRRRRRRRRRSRPRPSSIWEPCTRPAIVVQHEYWRLVTAMFLHAGLMHIFFNMISLYFLGLLPRARGGVEEVPRHLLHGGSGRQRAGVRHRSDLRAHGRRLDGDLRPARRAVPVQPAQPPHVSPGRRCAASASGSC